jgi:hypothetical protein
MWGSWLIPIFYILLLQGLLAYSGRVAYVMGLFGLIGLVPMFIYFTITTWSSETAIRPSVRLPIYYCEASDIGRSIDSSIQENLLYILIQK